VQNKLEKDKTALSRRKLLGDMGKLAYVAPTLTVFSLLGSSVRGDTISSPPCPPEDQNCVIEPSSASRRKQNPQTDRKRPKG